MPEISVIMLTYNREKVLERAIESILNQSFSDFEFVIVDNGSHDNTPIICNKWKNRDSRIKVVCRDKGNIGAGRNTGLSYATGKYITFVDDDDYFENDMLEFLYVLAQKYDADIAICGSARDTDGIITPKFVFDEELVLDKVQGVHELLRRKYYSSGFPTKLIKKSVINNIRFLENVRYEDIHVCYKCFANARRIAIQGKIKYYSTRHSGNNSSFTTNDNLLTEAQLKEYLNAFKERTVYLTNRIPTEASYYQYTEWSYMISMCRKIIITNNLECKTVLEQMKEELKNNIYNILNCKYLLAFEKEWLKEIGVFEK